MTKPFDVFGVAFRDQKKEHMGDESLGPHPAYQSYLPYVMSALLFGLSWPSYPYVRLEFLAWVWMVPMLLALKPVLSIWRFLLNIYLAMFLFSVVAMSWLITSSIAGTLLLFFFSAFIYTAPFAGFLFVRNTLGWRAALWSAPVLWTAWEWLYHQSEGSLGWLAMSLTQSNLNLLVQYIDITGVWGITFWLVLLNVLVVMAIEDCGLKIADCGLNQIRLANLKSAIRNPEASCDCNRHVFAAACLLAVCLR